MVLTLTVRKTGEIPVEVSEILPHPMTFTFVPTVIAMLERTRQTGETFSAKQMHGDMMKYHFILYRNCA